MLMELCCINGITLHCIMRTILHLQNYFILKGLHSFNKITSHYSDVEH